MYRLAVCEDEREQREELCAWCGEILERLGVEYELASFVSMEELEDALTAGEQFDLLCLDILMEGKNGMEFAQEMRRRDERTSILFITCTRDYLLEGYDVRPIQYLLKPVDPAALEKAIRTDLRLHHQPRTVSLQSGGNTVVLKLADIYYVESKNHGCIFYTPRGEQFFWQTMSQTEKMMPPDRFCRCHNSFLVNLDWIREVNSRGVIMEDGSRLNIGRRFAEKFQNQFIHYLNSDV